MFLEMTNTTVRGELLAGKRSARWLWIWKSGDASPRRAVPAGCFLAWLRCSGCRGGSCRCGSGWRAPVSCPGSALIVFFAGPTWRTFLPEAGPMCGGLLKTQGLRPFPLYIKVWSPIFKKIEFFVKKDAERFAGSKKVATFASAFEK